MNPAIVVNAYNRPRSLARLLESVQKACYPAGAAVPLIISLDDAGRHPQVEAVAQEFAWQHGPKEVVCHPERLGLLGHFYACGDLTQQTGALIYLEDDLLVSPVFYAYASQALAFYQDDPRIAGVSLYNLWFNGYTQQPFTPYLDEADVFFVQAPYTQGEAFTREQWAGFRAWGRQGDRQAAVPHPFHESWAHFDQEDWFPDWTRYMVSTGRFFVYPRTSLSTGSGDAGTHFSETTGFFQVPLQHEKLAYQMKALDASLAVYDSFFEILPDRLNRLTDLFQAYSYVVDLYASRSKANLDKEYVLTTRQCRNPRFTFGKARWPLEANVVDRTPGEGISFCRREDLKWGRLAELRTWASNRAYFSRGRLPGLREWVKLRLARLV